jgi:hypothetical protein
MCKPGFQSTENNRPASQTIIHDNVNSSGKFCLCKLDQLSVALQEWIYFGIHSSNLNARAVLHSLKFVERRRAASQPIAFWQV